MDQADLDPIGSDVEILDVYPSFSERYFQPKYLINAAEKSEEDHCVLVHSNRICIVTLAPSHPLIYAQKKIRKINFESAGNTNRLQNTVQGKRKHGAQSLQPLSVLCVVECEDGSEYSVRSCVYGKLIEINENIISNPQLLVEKPDSDGYVAIVLPNIKTNEKLEQELLLEEAYLKKVSGRVKDSKQEVE